MLTAKYAAFWQRMLLTAVLIPAAITSQQASAVCIDSGNAAGIWSAVAASADSHSPVTIRLEQGNYYFGQAPLEQYDAAELQILGGYDVGHSCDENHRTLDASKTTLQLDGNLLPLRSPDASITLEGLTIGGQTTGGGVNLHSSKIELRYVRIANQQKYQQPVVIGRSGSDATDIKMTNVQFDHILDTSSDPNCGITMILGGVGHSIANHMTLDMRATVGMVSISSDFCVDDGNIGGNKKIQLWNSILWDSSNTGGKLKAVHTGGDALKFYLYDVDFTDLSVAPTDTVQVDDVRYPNTQFDPLWTDPSVGDYSISAGANSVAVNSGTVDVAGGEPPYDLVADSRIVGSRPDLGAHESSFNDYAGANVFNVTNTNDVADPNSPLYPGSLRAAMDKAAVLNGKSLIQFFLPSCPSVIRLNGPLPLIWTELTLNGYTSSGSALNTDPSGFFNAQLCVAIQPVDENTVPTALIVPSGAHDASLTVKGIGFGAFAQAIQLWGGHSHQIVGNQFGGIMNGYQLFGFDIDAIRIEMSGSVIVGGPNPADRNVFLNANGWDGSDSAPIIVGVFTQNTQPVCQVIGNTFGITPDGFSAALSNEYGMLLQGNGCLIEHNRMAGHIKDAIYVLGGSGHVIQNNVIGPGLFFGQDFPNPGAGIRLSAGAANNVIGTPPGFSGAYYANTIKDMDSGGVIVWGDGDGNSIRGNQIAQNGLLTGLNIDLGNLGPEPNDPGDVDVGPNKLTNYPQPHAFSWVGGTPAPGSTNNVGKIQGLFDLAPGHYVFDAYYDRTCGASGHGGGGWMGSVELDVAAAGATPFTLFVMTPDYDPAHAELSVTATQIVNGQGSTSEVSRCLSVDTIFGDDFEH